MFVVNSFLVDQHVQLLVFDFNTARFAIASGSSAIEAIKQKESNQ
jgi:hypothetical protein